NPPRIEIATKGQQRRHRDKEIGNAIHTVTLYCLVPNDSSKKLIRGVPLRFSDAEILANLGQSQFELYTCRGLRQFKLLRLTFAGLEGHTCEPRSTLCGGSHFTAAPGCPNRFRVLYGSRDARRRHEPRKETQHRRAGGPETTPTPRP
ncbi:unnamed protein product, partial [Ixodes persulcatus]